MTNPSPNSSSPQGTVNTVHQARPIGAIAPQRPGVVVGMKKSAKPATKTAPKPVKRSSKKGGKR